MEEKIIIVENLKKYYGKVKAVDGVSFYVRKGEICSILGPNGAGKTTTLEIVEGLRKKEESFPYCLNFLIPIDSRRKL